MLTRTDKAAAPAEDITKLSVISLPCLESDMHDIAQHKQILALHYNIEGAYSLNGTARMGHFK
jgi:hypothetical protein